LVSPDSQPEPDTLAAVEEARAILTELGAKPFLERLDEVAGDRAGQGEPAAARA
jgi:hypothetical protein